MNNLDIQSVNQAIQGQLKARYLDQEFSKEDAEQIATTVFYGRRIGIGDAVSGLFYRI